SQARRRGLVEAAGLEVFGDGDIEQRGLIGPAEHRRAIQPLGPLDGAPEADGLHHVRLRRALALRTSHRPSHRGLHTVPSAKRSLTTYGPCPQAHRTLPGYRLQGTK